MKKFTLFLATMLLALATNLWAENATFGSDWNTLFGTNYSGTFTPKANALSLQGVVSEVTLLVKNGTSTNGYVKTSDFRAYNGYTITITAPQNYNITGISSEKGGKTFTSGISANVGSLTISDNAISWSGSSNSVVLSISGTVSFSTITVTYLAPSSVSNPVFTPEEGKVSNNNFTEPFLLSMSCDEGGTIVYTIDGTDPTSSETAEFYETAITIPAQSTIVRAIAMDEEANESNETSATYCYINSAATAYTATEAIAVIDKGLGLENELYVKGTINEIGSFNEKYGSLTYTITDGTKTFLIYSGLDIDGAQFTGTQNLNVGDEVVVRGIMKKYNSDYELDKNNQLVSRVVKTPIIEADDVEFGNIFATGKTQELVVKGHNLTEAIAYTMSENAAFTAEGTLTAEGGTITITFIGTTNGDYTATLTLTSGSVTSSVAVSASLLSLTGEGTKENPFTVEDVMAINSSLGTTEKYWVIGYIVGAINNSMDQLQTKDFTVNSNLALGGAAEATTYIPVALPSGDVRAALNLKDNSANLGKQVKVYGTLEKYFNVAGVKNVTDYELQKDPTAIDNAAVAEKAVKMIENGQLVIIREGVKYNAQGVRL